jgi:hypothetical protein
MEETTYDGLGTVSWDGEARKCIKKFGVYSSRTRVTWVIRNEMRGKHEGET